MIENKCFTKEWIAQKRQDLGRVDPALLEKSIYAMALLCGLAKSKLPFVFTRGFVGSFGDVKDWRTISSRFALEAGRSGAVSTAFFNWSTGTAEQGQINGLRSVL